MELLAWITKTAKADGCIMWQEVPYDRLRMLSTGPAGQLFAMASWFPNGNASQIVREKGTSATANSIFARRTRDVVHIRESDTTQHELLKQRRITSFTTVPVTLQPRVKGALNLYRRDASSRSFNDISNLERVASIMPALIASANQRYRYQTVWEISQLLAASDSDGFDRTAAAACHAIASAFDAVETSLFLRNPEIASDAFHLCATTLPEDMPFPKRLYDVEDNPKSITSWIAANKRPVHIFDLTAFAAERPQLKRRYPGIQWSDSLDIDKLARAALGLNGDEALPPVSFVGAPLIARGEVIGVVRCCLARRAPYYFSQGDEQLLSLLAEQMARAWDGEIRRLEFARRERTSQQLLSTLERLNGLVAGQAEEESVTEQSVFEPALEAVSSLIEVADISDIRLLDSKRGDLYFAATVGAEWSSGDPDTQQARLNRRFPLGDVSGGASVMRTGETLLIDDVRNHESYSQTFDNVNQMIITPIVSGGQRIGVLDIRTVGDGRFAQIDRTSAKVLGQLLGLYHHLLSTIRRLRDLAEEQARIFQDLAHQVRSPALHLHARIERLARVGRPLTPDGDGAERELRVLRALAGRVRDVSRSVAVFAALERGERVPTTLSAELSSDVIVGKIVGAASDREIMSDPLAPRYFHVDRMSFRVLRTNMVLLDLDLVLQALHNVLDNAAKYSYPHTTTRIEAAKTSTGRFRISVINHGIRLSSHHARECVGRGWQGEDTDAYRGEGLGLGLWIVDHIMRAHGGELSIMPTNSKGETEFQLLFPVQGAARGNGR